MSTDKSLEINTISDEEKLTIANQLVSSLREQNWALLASIITEDVTWSIPGKNLISDVVSGIDEVIDRTKAIMEHHLGVHVYNVQLSYVGFALSTHIEAVKDDVDLDVSLTMVFTLKGNRISGVKTYVSDLVALDEFFGDHQPHKEDLESVLPGFEQKSNAANTFLTAMKTNNWQLMQSAMLPEIEWTLPGKSLLSGPAVGVDAVIKRAQSLKQFGVMFELLHILYGWDGVALSLHNTGKRDDLLLDEYVTIVFQLDGDKITALTTHLSDVPGINQFFVPGIID